MIDGDSVVIDGVAVVTRNSVQFIDGSMLEDSRARGRPFQFKIGVGQVIKGMDILIKQMSRGQRAKAVIPPDLAYGVDGRYPLIPANATLLFEVRQ